jgi:hypothetical protein
MYCSNCGIQNKEDANFCRRCGQSFQKPSINPLPDMKNPDQMRAFKKLIMGIGFIALSGAFRSTTKPLSGLLLFLGIVMVIKGIRRLSWSGFAVCSNHSQLATTPFHRISETAPQRVQTNSQVRQTGELVPPPSVTENTTKLFDRQ